jgi:hypothetical protein
MDTNKSFESRAQGAGLSSVVSLKGDFSVRFPMGELTDREKDFLEALTGTSKSAISLLPVVGRAIAGWDAYKRSSFDREVKQFLIYLSQKGRQLGTVLSA